MEQTGSEKGTNSIQNSETNGQKNNPNALINGPYIKNGHPNGRPKLTGKKRLEFEIAVYNRCVGTDGILYDPNTHEVLNWKPGQSRRGLVDFGHVSGKTYNEMFLKYKNGQITLEQLKAFQFDPNNYRIEAPSANRSHK